MKEITLAEAAKLTSPQQLVLVCTRKADGTPNMAPVSFFSFASFREPMVAVCLGKASCSGENIRRNGKAVIAVPGAGIAAEVKAFGTVHGDRADKLDRWPIAMQTDESSDIPFPSECRTAYITSLVNTVEAGDHLMYLLKVEKSLGDGTVSPLFAWDGYARVAPLES